MSVSPPYHAQPALRWAGSLILVSAVHLAAGAWWLSRAALVMEPPPLAVLIDLEPAPEPMPAPESVPEPAPPEAPPPPPPDIVPQPEPAPAPPPKPDPPKPPPRPVPRQAPRPMAAPPAPTPQPTPTSAPAAVPPPRPVAVPASWTSRLFAHLARHKRYPAEAQQRRQEGTTLVRVVMDRAGRVLSVRLEQGSGFPLLDAEAQALVQRAQPLPPLPDEVTAATVEIVVPLSFRVR